TSVDKSHYFMIFGMHPKGLGHACPAFQRTNRTSGTGVQQILAESDGQQYTCANQKTNMVGIEQGKTNNLHRWNTRNAIVTPQETQVAIQVIKNQTNRNRTERQVMPRQT